MGIVAYGIVEEMAAVKTLIEMSIKTATMRGPTQDCKQSRKTGE
jgi:hypothetical protein